MKRPNPFQKSLFLVIALTMWTFSWVLTSHAQSASTENSDFPSTPILRIETGFHTAVIRRIDVDAQERFVVSASDDKSVRIWDLHTGNLLRTFYLPATEGDVGKAYAVAISPDGNTIAVGGFTQQNGKSQVIYLFDRQSAQISHRITGLENAALNLTYSPDGKYLAASLGGANGIRIYRTSDYEFIRADRDYADRSNWADFDPQNRLITTSDDGKLRLYDSNFELIRSVSTNKQPFAAVFSPEGSHIAVGYDGETSVDVYDADTLKLLFSADTTLANNGNLGSVAWSNNGHTLYAGGRYDKNGDNPIFRWSQKGRGAFAEWVASQNTIMDLKPLKNGGLLVGSFDPVLAKLDSMGNPDWSLRPQFTDFRGQRLHNSIRLSENADIVHFGLELWGKNEVQFSLRSFELTLSPQNKSSLFPAITESNSIHVENWIDQLNPQLNGTPLSLKPYERSRSLAIAPDEQSFVLGSEWHLRHYDRDGKLRWMKPGPSAVWTLNISRDGRFVVAGFGDGTLRWYDLKTGDEQLALFVMTDQRWVAWMPEGFYAASEEAKSLIGYQLNNGDTQAPSFVKVGQLYEPFHRPDLLQARIQGDEALIARELKKIGDVRQVLAQGLPPKVEWDVKSKNLTYETTRFELPLKITDQGGGIGRIEVRVNGKLLPKLSTKAEDLNRFTSYSSADIKGDLTPGKNVLSGKVYNKKNSVVSESAEMTIHVELPDKLPTLYAIAVGVAEYRDRDLDLEYPDDDVRELKKVLETHKHPLFKAVHVETLINRQATVKNIKATFEKLRPKIQPHDIFILYLSGHAMALGGEYHFLPREFIYRNNEALKTDSLSENRINEFLQENVAAQKNLIILDSCHAGSFGPEVAFRLKNPMAEKTAIARLMNKTGSAVLYASSDQDYALEGYKGHSLFTWVLLEGLKGKADTSAPGSPGHGEVSVSELANYLEDMVPMISHQAFGFETFPMRDVRGHSFPITKITTR